MLVYCRVLNVLNLPYKDMFPVHYNPMESPARQSAEIGKDYQQPRIPTRVSWSDVVSDVSAHIKHM